jgi:hypothetical protein
MVSPVQFGKVTYNSQRNPATVHVTMNDPFTVEIDGKALNILTVPVQTTRDTFSSLKHNPILPFQVGIAREKLLNIYNIFTRATLGEISEKQEIIKASRDVLVNLLVPPTGGMDDMEKQLNRARYTVESLT